MMGSDAIVFSQPRIDRNLGLLDAVEPLTVQNLSTQNAIKPFILPSLPR